MRHRSVRNHFLGFLLLPLPHGVRSFSLRLTFFPFWALSLMIALIGLAQRLVEFTSRPFLPPGKVTTNFETGTSGTRPKVVRMPPRKLSIRPTRSTVTWPFRWATMSGSVLFEERR